MPTVIHIVEDDASFRGAVSRMLRIEGYAVEGYENAQQLLDKLPDNADAGCILLDLQIPGISGVDLQDRLAALGSTMPIVFLSGHGDIAASVQAIKAGAEDFLTKPVSRAVLMEAIERALIRQHEVHRQHHEMGAMRMRLNKLTPREREVFDLVVRGRLNKQIAHTLGTTERTVKAHRHRVMEKVQVRSLAELVSLAMRLNLIDTDNPKSG